MILPVSPLKSDPSAVETDDRWPRDGRHRASERFAFHLYAANHLVSRGRFAEAAEEIDAALAIEANDPAGLNLLAVIRFRMGDVAAAAEVYEALLKRHPAASELQVNLALCRLRLGEPSLAQPLLESALRSNPEHGRAWGYLGFALEQMGEFERAQAAFKRGGHQKLARRTEEKRREAGMHLEPQPPVPTSVARDEADRSPGPEVHDLVAEHDVPDESVARPVARLRLAVSSTREPSSPVERPMRSTGPSAHSTRPSADSGLGLRTSLGAAKNVMSLAAATERARLLEDHTSLVHHEANGLIVIQLRGTAMQNEFSVRSDLLHSISGRLRHTPPGQEGLHEGPFSRLEGEGRVTLQPRRDHHFRALTWEDDDAYIDEHAVAGFQTQLDGRHRTTVVHPAQTACLMHLRGRGIALLELQTDFVTLHVRRGEHVSVRIEALIGWTGQLKPSFDHEAPSGSERNGLVALQGRGVILLRTPERTRDSD